MPDWQLVQTSRQDVWLTFRVPAEWVVHAEMPEVECHTGPGPLPVARAEDSEETIQFEVGLELSMEGVEIRSIGTELSPPWWFPLANRFLTPKHLRVTRLVVKQKGLRRYGDNEWYAIQYLIPKEARWDAWIVSPAKQTIKCRLSGPLEQAHELGGLHDSILSSFIFLERPL